MTEQDMERLERAARMTMALDDGGPDDFLNSDGGLDVVARRSSQARRRSEKAVVWSAGALLLSLPFTR